MADAQPLHPQLFKGGDGQPYSFFRSIHEVATTDHSMYCLYPGKLLGMVQGIDDAAVGTAQDDHQSRLSIYNQRLVIQKLIWLKAIVFFYLEVRLYLLVIGGHGNLAGGHYITGYPHRLFGQIKPGAKAFQCLAVEGYADIPLLFPLAAAIFNCPDIRVSDYLYPLSYPAQYLFEPAGMVGVTVA